MNKCKHTWPGKRTGDSCPDCWKDKGEMKPLKDIGREVVELSDMEFVDPDTVDWGDEPETPKFTVYSIDERRELVREALERWNKLCFGERNATIPSVEEFIKSEGL